jgi:BMFP domain-containing protein YqiC
MTDTNGHQAVIPRELIHRDYAADGHDHDTSHDHPELTSHDHPELTSREAVAAMLEAFRVDMRDILRGRVGELEGRLEQAEAARSNHNSQIAALSDRAAALEAIVTPPLPAGKNRFDAVERKIQLVDQTVGNLISPTMLMLEGRLDRLEAALDQEDQADDAGTVEVAGHAFQLADDDSPADVPPNICPGGC